MIWYDVTKSAGARHSSGLLRVSRRLREELGAEARAFRWPEVRQTTLNAKDWVVTAEVFAPEDRPGWDEFLERRPCRFAAIYHDAIPLKLPHVTWPQSVARHPAYLKMLARMDRVLAVSQASREELREFWQWQGVTPAAEVGVLPLGADFASGVPRTRERIGSGRRLLAVGIIEPRKNQGLLLDAAARLWDEGLEFGLDLVGRVNPHYGRDLQRRIRTVCRRYPGLRYHGAVADARLTALFQSARATVFATRAEGCGLPLLESLWRAVPCLHSDLAVLRENADGGGCVAVAWDDLGAWTSVLRRVLTDDAWVAQLTTEAVTRPLPTWADAAARLRTVLAAA